jgi:hypothetical protein
MNMQEWYEIGQANCGIEVGDAVKVLRKATGNTMGWGQRWVSEMDKYVGQTFIVANVPTINTGIRLLTKDDYGFWNFPFFILELVSHKPVIPSLPPKIVEIIDNGDFGCHKKSVKDLISAVLEEFARDKTAKE